MASCFLEAAEKHLQARGQKDTLTAHFEYLSRTETGPAVLVVEDVKTGRQLSVLHITLYQQGLLPHAPWITPGTSRKEVVAYISNTDLSKERGLSLPTGYSLESPPPPADLRALSQGRDANWEPLKTPPGRMSYMRSLKNFQYFSPRRGQVRKSIIDLWIRLASGEGFTNTTLGYVADCWPYVVEAYRPPKPAAEGEAQSPFAFDETFWYPTVALNLEVKKALPSKGAQWLSLRVAAKQVMNGRLDLEVIIMDESGDLVALSQHVNLIVGSERNLSQRRQPKGQL